MNEREQARRNLNPHKAARAAMWLWGERYAAQGGGSMDFWDKLSERDKHFCRAMVKAIEKSPAEEAA